MTWENIIKADFSFRDVIKNSRGIYSKILGRIQITPQLTELGGNLLGDALKALEEEEGLTVTNKRKIAEVVLLEPMLIGIDMMNDPEMEDRISVIERDTVSDIGPKDEKDSSDSNSEELIQALQKVIDDLGGKVMVEFRKEITKIVDKKMPEIAGQKKHELTQAIMPVINGGAFIDYIAIITSALIRKMTDDSKKLSLETEPDIDITDDKFSEAFQQANKMDWKDILKFNQKSLNDITAEMDKLMGNRTKFNRAYNAGNYGNEDESKKKISMIMDELVADPKLDKKKAQRLKQNLDSMGF
jgi:hypothetical protein